MKISAVIPTYRRPGDLRRLLESISSLEVPFTEIILGVRDTDQDTLEALSAFPHFGPVALSIVKVPGVIASMQAALDKTTGDLVAIMDDDVELPPDWTRRVVDHFQAHPELGLLGGRDMLQDNLAARAAEPRQRKVGLHFWYGGAAGNHHCGIGGYRLVDVLKGCNIAGRGDVMRRVRFEKNLKGQGAQVAWEFAFCYDVKAAGYSIAYDSDLMVRHFVASRFDADVNQRGGYSGEALYNEVFNIHYCYGTRLPLLRVLCCFLWNILWGSHHAPGFLQYIRIKFFRRDPNANDRLRRTLAGSWAGMAQALKAPR